MKLINYKSERHEEFLKRYSLDENGGEIKAGAEDKLFHSVNSEEKDSKPEQNEKTYVITDSSIDRVDEIVDPKGLGKKEFDNSKKTIFFNHNYNLPVGKSISEKQLDESWIATAKFSDATQLSKDVRNLAFDGILGMTSIGFIPKALEITNLEDIKDLNPSNRKDYDKKSKIWIWRKSELLEWSIVGVGANRNANEVGKMLAKSMIKSDEMKNYFEAELFKMELEEKIAEQEVTIKSFAEQIEAVKGGDYDKLKKEFDEFKEQFTKKNLRGDSRRKTLSAIQIAEIGVKVFAGAISGATGKKFKIN
jgi:uncharacterized coiled-coil protein SlyX